MAGGLRSQPTAASSALYDWNFSDGTTDGWAVDYGPATLSVGTNGYNGSSHDLNVNLTGTGNPGFMSPTLTGVADGDVVTAEIYSPTSIQVVPYVSDASTTYTYATSTTALTAGTWTQVQWTIPSSVTNVRYIGFEVENGGGSAGTLSVGDVNITGPGSTPPPPGGTPHVMVLMMENQSVPDVIGSSSAPYQTQLSKNYEYATQSYGLGHFSLDNYLGLVSGNWYSWSTGDCSPGSGCMAPSSAQTLANQFDTAGISWRAYMGSMTSDAKTSDDNGGGNGYGVRHDPFVYFPGLSGDTSDIQPAGTSSNWDSETNLINGLNSSSAPSFVWYSPSICQDGGGDSAPNCSGGATISAGDNFLKSEIPAIQATSWYKNGGTIILTYDEGDSSGQGQGEYTTGAGNHVPTIVISAATTGAANYTSYVNHWGVLGGIEQAYGLSYLGNAANSPANGRLPLPDTSASTATATATAPQPIGPGGSWNLTFDDEFSGTSLDTTKWATGWFGSGITDPVNSSEQECYDPNQVTESGGYLNITVTHSSCQTPSGHTYPYRSGLVSSNPSSGASNAASPGFQQAYGFFEARIYLPGSNGQIYNWPAWWTDGQSWPADGEMDIMEGLSGQACYHFHSPSGGPGGCASGAFTGWHTYGADWEPGSVTYYYDGNVVGKITSGITSAPMYLILDDAVSSSTGGPTVAPSTMLVDYVRAWSKA
jgi:hypothetical protein